MHTNGVEVLARFAQDFYRGMPAVTRFRCGSGQAYYVGTRLNQQARQALFEMILRESSCHIPFQDPLPEGVTVQWRGVCETLFAFAMNFSSQPHQIGLGSFKLTDVETRTIYENCLPLGPLQARVFEVS
jgi:beta-galactosidase